MREKQEQNKSEVIRQLSEMIDLVEFQMVIGRKSKFGKRPHKDDPDWGYTKAMLKSYTVPIDLEDIKKHFAKVGCHNEKEAAMWIAINLDEVP